MPIQVLNKEFPRFAIKNEEIYSEEYKRKILEKFKLDIKKRSKSITHQRLGDSSPIFYDVNNLLVKKRYPIAIFPKIHTTRTLHEKLGGEYQNSLIPKKRNISLLSAQNKSQDNTQDKYLLLLKQNLKKRRPEYLQENQLVNCYLKNASKITLLNNFEVRNQKLSKSNQQVYQNNLINPPLVEDFKGFPEEFPMQLNNLKDSFKKLVNNWEKVSKQIISNEKAIFYQQQQQN